MAGQVPSIQGRQYTNRTDLQNAPRRQPAAQARPQPQGAPQRMPQGGTPLGLPVPQPQASVPAGGAPTPGAPPAADYSMESVPNVTDPSRRPGESVLTGATLGFQRDGASDPLAMRLRAAYMADPDPALMQMILGLEQGDQDETNQWDGAPVAGGNRFHGVW